MRNSKLLRWIGRVGVIGGLVALTPLSGAAADVAADVTILVGSEVQPESEALPDVVVVRGGEVGGARPEPPRVVEAPAPVETTDPEAPPPAIQLTISAGAAPFYIQIRQQQPAQLHAYRAFVESYLTRRGR